MLETNTNTTKNQNVKTLQHAHLLNYDPTYLQEKWGRELSPFYITATDSEIDAMLKVLGMNKLSDLYAHIDPKVRFTAPLKMDAPLSYDHLIKHLFDLSGKNNTRPSFIGGGLQDYKTTDIVPFVCSLRNLTTAYTPYQPERSQGTLQTLWIYSSSLSMLTGFEAINASFYDRSTCLFEAINTATRLVKESNVALVSEGLFHKDIEVLKTHAIETKVEIVTIPTDKKTGRTCQLALEQAMQKYKNRTACLVFSQVNTFGLLEDVHALTDFCHRENIQSIAVIDPMLLATEGLTPPSQFGLTKDAEGQIKGAHMIVGEGQHLAIGPNFGGPGLGIFGIRFNEKNKNDIRQTAGRFVGKTKDQNGLECLCMVLSTREQHIRREKATSNICSNQSFVASIAGASMLTRGENGMTQAVLSGRQKALAFAQKILQKKDVSLAFSQTPFFNEVAIDLSASTFKSARNFLDQARTHGLHLGLDITQKDNHGEALRPLVLVSFTDKQSENDLNKLFHFIDAHFAPIDHATAALNLPNIPSNLLRAADQKVGLPNLSLDEVKALYQKFNDLNVSPDDNIYPLGSCTMKYNPYINDWAASLAGFTELHPDAPIEDAQGSLQVLFEIQEMFKAITGLSAVTTQPVAGAQGELVGIKLFQAYHRDRNEAEQRNIVLIPRSAHGTNPATATMAGIQTKVENGITYGIVTIEANEHGQIHLEQLKKEVEKYQQRILGIMVTNPNTSGIFESEFHQMAELIHAVGGLVYMDGANMNAIAGHVDLNKLGVDAVHNNLHKTWTIPHGGGGPGDGIVAVSEKLVDYLPGVQIELKNGVYTPVKKSKSIGEFHRHYGNFAHKVRAYTYLKSLGGEGVLKMSAMAVLSARYLLEKLKTTFPILPEKTDHVPRMHEFILTLQKESFEKCDKAKTPKAQAIAKIGKLFLDFGGHAPTVAFPEVFGLMIEPTESYSKKELDQFVEVVESIHSLIEEHPEVLQTAPHFTPVRKVDEVYANKELRFFDLLHKDMNQKAALYENKIHPLTLAKMSKKEVMKAVIAAHQETKFL